jgi:hypothetical protein
MTVQLHPSFIRAGASVLTVIVALTAATYFWQGYHEHHWWRRDYIISLLIPLTIAPLAVCFMFVPRRLEFSETHFTIQLPFRRLYMIKWEDLQYYGSGENVFMIQFSGIGTFQIFAQAFRRSEWRMLKNFLSATFPERKASGYFGGRMFRWPHKKT